MKNRSVQHWTVPSFLPNAANYQGIHIYDTCYQRVQAAAFTSWETPLNFELSADTKIARTELGCFVDRLELPSGEHYYCVVFDNEKERTKPVRVSVNVERTQVVK